jgi:hypothetical protein
MTRNARQPCGAWRARNGRVDFLDVSHQPQPNSRDPGGSTQTNNAGIGSIAISRVLTFSFIPCKAASSILKSWHLLA